MTIYLTFSNTACLSNFSPSQRRQGRKSQRGVALVITLLLLALVTVLSLGMVIALSSQTLIGGYYRNFRGSFYAADSGLNIARQQLKGLLVAGLPTAWAAPPIANPASLASNVLSTLASSYGSSTTLNSGTAGQSWAENFTITNSSLALAPNSPTITSYDTSTGTCTPVLPCPNGFQYIYNYGLTVVGTAQGSEKQTITETGTVTLNITGLAASSKVNFSYFGGFVDIYPAGIGPLVPGTMTGPMFSNNAWEFMAAIPPWTAPYIFSDPIGQVWSQADYWDSGWGQHWSSASSWGSGANLVAPNFEGGFFLGQPPVLLPTNGFNQAEAVIDGNGTLWPSTQTAAQTGTALSVLKNLSGSAYSGTGTQGIYFNKGTTSGTTTGTCPASVTPPCIAGGGFYVEGGADVKLVPSGATAQIYNITQNGVLTTITIDPAANSGIGTTVITSGSTTQTLNGVPINTITAQASTMVFVDGNVTIHGPGEGQGAIQDNTMITVTANANASTGQSGDIIATGDVLYKTEPVSIPQDALIPAAANMNQVLGLFTATGNFITQDAQADQNIEVDASIATISASDSANNCASREGGQLSIGHINTFNNVGGMAQSCIYAADVNTENTWFDRRFTSRPNFAPPWFPSTTVQTGGSQPVNASVTVQRIQWLNTSAQ